MSPVADLAALRTMARRQRRAVADRARAEEQRARAARLEVKRLTAAFLSIAPDLEKVVLFGSLAHGRGRSTRSDIDLAVQCRKEAFLPLVAEALRSSFEVDVVDLSDAEARILSAIDREGEVIYEK